MRLRREVSLGIGAILVLQILLSILAIGLLTRMGPAIEHIIQENVVSSEAVEEMASILAMSPPTGPVPEGFENALKRAKANVTEQPEGPLLVTIEEHRTAAFGGDPTALQTTVTALRKLGQVNRDSMRLADAKAKRLGQTGAWAAAMLGALTLALGIMVYRRLRLRLELPIEDLRRTTQNVRSGNLQARCIVGAGPLEIRQIANDFNWLLDQWLHQNRAGSPVGDDEKEAEIRRVLAYLLDRDPAPVVVVDEKGTPVAANRAGMMLAPNTAPDEAWVYDEVPGTSLRFARLLT